MPPPRSAPASPSLASWRVGLMRVAARLWMLAYLLVAAGAPVLDGAMGHEEAVAHWEDVGGGQCPATHSADDCQLCQLVHSVRAASAGSRPLLELESGVAPMAAVEVRIVASRAPVEAIGPRGPPQA